MTPTIGRIVHYTLTVGDAMAINQRRTTGASIRDRLRADPRQWPQGAQAHVGSYASEGDVVPLIVVKVWPHELGENVPGVNGQALLDGNDALWVTSVSEGTGPGAWAWPVR